jgi:hypothetical protein
MKMQEPIFLPDVEQNPKPSPYRDLIEAAQSTGGDYWQIWQAGWTDGSIFYAISACALFDFYNRWISASGVHPVSDQAFKGLASRMAAKGYIRG